MVTDVLQVVTGGVLLGGTYALAALGLSITLGVLNVLNIAHGDFLMLGGLVGYWLFVLFRVNPFLALVLVMPLFFLAGFPFERVLIRPAAARARGEFLTASILATVGASLAIEDVTAFVWGPEIKGIAYSLPSLQAGDVLVSPLRLAVLAVIGLLTIGLHLFLTRTFAGRAIRAVTQDRVGAMLVGVNIPRTSMLAFGVGTSLAAAAGVVYATLFTISPFMGIPLTMKYLVIVVLGGLGSVLGTLGAALVLAQAETLAALLVGPAWSPAVAFLALVTILLIRPEGLLGRREVAGAEP